MIARDLSLRGRVVLAVAITSLVSSIGLLLWLPLQIEREAALAAEQRSLDIAVVVATALAPGLDFGDERFLEERLGLLAAVPDARWAVVRDATGAPLARFGDPRSGDAPAAIAGAAVARLDPAGIVVTAPVHTRSGVEGVLELGLSRDALDAQLSRSRRAAGTTVALSLAGATILAWSLGLAIAAPLTALTRTVRLVALGKLGLEALRRSLPPAEHREDEVLVLAHAFSRMAERIRAQMVELDTALARAVRAEETAVEASATKSMFLANMSHELRTPLTAIIGYCELLLDEAADGGPTAPIRADLEAIHRASHHQLQLVNDLLDLAKVEAGELSYAYEDVDLARAVGEVAAAVALAAARNGTTVEVAIDPDVPAIRTDPLRFAQCLLNVVSNAVKFTERGRVTVRVRAEAEGVAVEVRDTGIGMSREVLGRLFQPFAQAPATPRRYGGTGLGLALTGVLVRNLGGHIDVASTPGVGSTFTIHLPLRAPGRAANAA